MIRTKRAIAVKALAAILTVGLGYVSGQQVTILNKEQIPEFSDYETIAYKGTIARPRITRDPDVQTFKTRILAAAGKIPNFAGHYHIITWGCGGGCRMGAAINVKSGQVMMLPFTISGSLEYRKDSRLLVANGVRDESETDDEADRHFYEVSGTKFLYIGTFRPGSSSGSSRNRRGAARRSSIARTEPRRTISITNSAFGQERPDA